MNSKHSKPPPDSRQSLKALAKSSGISESTLRARMARHGDLERALHEKKASHQAAGRKGAAKSPWRFGGH